MMTARTKTKMKRFWRHRTVVCFQRTVAGLAYLMCFSGCTERIGDFTAISTKNIYAKGVDVSKLPRARGVKGTHIRFLGIGANIQDALDNALAEGDGNLMIDCALYMWSAPFFSGYTVRGDVVAVPYGEPSSSNERIREGNK